MLNPNRNAFDFAPTAPPPPSFSQGSDRQTAWSEGQNCLSRLGSSSLPLGTPIRPNIGVPDKDLQINWYSQPKLRFDFTENLRSLQRYYTLLDSDRVVMDVLADEAILFPLLIEAVQPLKKAFGERRIIHVRIQNSDDDRLVRVTVQLPRDFQSPETALEAFDADWWISNCNRSAGGLVFDYEIQDGI